MSQTSKPAQSNSIGISSKQLLVLEKLCESSGAILNRYYDVPLGFQCVGHFLVAPDEALGTGGAVLVHEDHTLNEVSLGICFGNEFVEQLSFALLTPHEVCVLAEETGHFFALAHAAVTSAKLSLFDLETLGEIDRFLALLHWNTFAGQLSPTLRSQPVNLSEACDLLFAGDRFCRRVTKDTLMMRRYIEAEERAFFHIKSAFEHVWTSAFFNSGQVDMRASDYLRSLRRSLLGPLPSSTFLDSNSDFRNVA
jgi:hypothetical protein